MRSDELQQQAAAVHRAAVVVDGHADTAQRFVDEGWRFSSPLGEGDRAGHLNAATAAQGGLDAEFFAIWVEPTEWRGRYAARTLQLIDGVLEQVRHSDGAMRLGLSPGDIRQAKADGVFCALMGIEGGHSIEDDLALLRSFYRLGVRYITLTWTNTNSWADSSGDLDDPAVSHHGGLTAFGRDVVREMNWLGMMVDISHVADATFWDVLRTTRAPVIASHSSARALVDIPRNLSDEQMRAIATSNGLVMVNFYASFIDVAWREAWSATAEERAPLYEAASAPFRKRGTPVPYSVALEVDRRFARERMNGVPRPKFETLIDHFDHVAQVAGIDHVGIGSDFDGFSILPEGIASAADLPRITEALMRRGYTAGQMEKLLGGNLLRVFEDVQRLAQE